MLQDHGLLKSFVGEALPSYTTRFLTPFTAQSGFSPIELDFSGGFSTGQSVNRSFINFD